MTERLTDAELDALAGSTDDYVKENYRATPGLIQRAIAELRELRVERKRQSDVVMEELRTWRRLAQLNAKSLAREKAAYWAAREREKALLAENAKLRATNTTLAAHCVELREENARLRSAGEAWRKRHFNNGVDCDTCDALAATLAGDPTHEQVIGGRE